MMDLRIFLYLFVIILGLVFIGLPNTQRNRSIYINIILTMLILESCLRGLSVGTDTFKYKVIFDGVNSMSWDELFKMFRERYIEHANDMDVGYWILQKVVHIFSHDFQVFLFVCALFFFIPFGNLLKRFDIDMWDLVFIFVFYVALFNPIAMSGTRKEIALGISILCVIKYLDKKYISAIIWFILGFFVHMSILGVLLIPALNLFGSKFIKVIHGISFLTIPASILFSGQIIGFFAESVDNEHYSDYAQDVANGGGMTFVLLMELIILLCFIFIKRESLGKSYILKTMYSALPFATFFVPLITNNGSMIRLSQYFHIYVLFLLPYLISRVFTQDKRSLYGVLTILLFAMSMASDSVVSEYQFFWSDPMNIDYIG